MRASGAARGALVGATASQCGGRRLRVAPGDPDASFGMCSGSRMPKTTGPLSSEDIERVRAWISGL